MAQVGLEFELDTTAPESPERQFSYEWLALSTQVKEVTHFILSHASILILGSPNQSCLTWLARWLILGNGPYIALNAVDMLLGEHYLYELSIANQDFHFNREELQQTLLVLGFLYVPFLLYLSIPKFNDGIEKGEVNEV